MLRARGTCRARGRAPRRTRPRVYAQRLARARCRASPTARRRNPARERELGPAGREKGVARRRRVRWRRPQLERMLRAAAVEARADRVRAAAPVTHDRRRTRPTRPGWAARHETVRARAEAAPTRWTPIAGVGEEPLRADTTARSRAMTPSGQSAPYQSAMVTVVAQRAGRGPKNSDGALPARRRRPAASTGGHLGAASRSSSPGYDDMRNARDRERCRLWRRRVDEKRRHSRRHALSAPRAPPAPLARTRRRASIVAVAAGDRGGR